MAMMRRRALPAPGSRRQEEAAPFVAPRTPIEEMVAEIFVEVLGSERVGIHDDFFALGGHSLLATRALAQLEDLFALEIPLRVLFEAPTVARLVVALGELLLAQSELQPEPEAAQDPVVGGEIEESVPAELAAEREG